MIKTFIFGVILGIVALAAALYLLPVVDQTREVSIISVAPNGGNTEVFHVNFPADRVMVGGRDQTALPAELVWPADEIFSSVSAEIFKVRNARDTVIGVAARTVAREGDSSVLDWVIHLPARGSLYVNVNPVPGESGIRTGQIRAGSREMAGLSGSVAERWVSDTSGEDDALTGRIELTATYVARPENDE